MRVQKPILLVGCGIMAIEYSKVLRKMGKKFLVVGRSKSSAKNFYQNTGIKALTGGIEKYLRTSNGVPDLAIVAVTEDQLGIVTKSLINAGLKSILVEKPGGFNTKEIFLVKKAADKNGCRVFIGYNRRFYSSVQKAQEIINQDGEVLSFQFEFTELTHKIEKLNKNLAIKEEWFLHNSTHPIDLAFYLGGKPKDFVCYQTKSLPWHHKGAIFAGAGQTKEGALFSYCANWQSAGRWGIELETLKHRLILRPLEKLQLQEKGSFDFTEVKLNDKLDINFKSGLYKQVEAFLSGHHNLCTIDEQCENLKIYNKICRKQ